MHMLFLLSAAAVASKVTPLSSYSSRAVGSWHSKGKFSYTTRQSAPGHVRRSSAVFSSSSNESSVSVTLETASGSKTIQIERGELLRSAMLKRGLSPHNGRARLINCRGLGTCGTCAVEVSCSNKSVIEPNERNAKENLRLNLPPHGSLDQSPNLRLACQVQVYDDIVVKKRTGFWGQDTDDTLADGYDAELWFGDLEYLLDNKSPVKKKE